jgi:hypothetical protein
MSMLSPDLQTPSTEPRLDTHPATVVAAIDEAGYDAVAAGLLTDIGVLMVTEHVVMLLAMAGVMLLRPEEYIHHHGRAHHTVVEPVLAEQVTA